MITFLTLAHMVGATQHHVPCTCTHGRCYASHGMGWGGDDNVPCTFEHLEHHNISKIVILPHKSHVSHKYKCMNDGFLINQHADQKKFVRAEHNSM